MSLVIAKIAIIQPPNSRNDRRQTRSVDLNICKKKDSDDGINVKYEIGKCLEQFFLF